MATARQIITDALREQDVTTIKRFAHDPAMPKRLREFLNNWLRHYRGLEVSASCCQQELRVFETPGQSRSLAQGGA